MFEDFSLIFIGVLVDFFDVLVDFVNALTVPHSLV